ncbi:MAG: aquaporin Z [Acidimicrobiales bacterium]
MNPAKELTAEFLGTLWLVLGGCGSAVFAAQFLANDGAINMGIGFLGVALAFGLTVVTGAYALGHISGGHFNPAVTLGLVAGGKFSPSKVVQYIVAQVLGGLVGALIIYFIANGQDGFAIGDTAGTFATNGYGDFSPGGYTMGAVFLAEVVLTAIFLIVILGATAKRAAAGMGGMAIGLALTLIHLISIPISNTSVNPARSTAQAVVAAIFGDSASTPVSQLWLFWVAPIIGAVIGGGIYKALLDTDND